MNQLVRHLGVLYSPIVTQKLRPGPGFDRKALGQQIEVRDRVPEPAAAKAAMVGTMTMILLVVPCASDIHTADRHVAERG